MSASVELNGDTVGIGRGALHVLRNAMQQDLGEQAAVRLQEVGHAAGADVFGCFVRWLKATAGIEDPGAIAADQLGSVLADFFQALGWGRITMGRVGSGTLAFDTSDWAEADPQANGLLPSCYLSAGLLAGFMGRLAQREIAVMEVECRSASHPRCRFLLGKPEALEAVYQALTEGKDYSTVI
jgi:predicted hydrocarbon binding protein